MKAIKGGHLHVFATIDGKLKALAMATSHTLNVTMDTKETTSKDSGGKFQELEGGVIAWNASSENVYTVDPSNPGAKFEDMLDLMLSQEPIKIVLGLRAENTDEVPDAGWTPGAGCYTGDALITECTRNSPVGENATISIKLQGTGKLEKYNTHDNDSDNS